MQSSYWGYWLIVLGVGIIGLMISVQGITTNTTQDYYSLREITEASMLEAVDYGYYRDYNEVKMNKEKFMEVFVRMLAETMGTADTYEVNFYAIYEAPPKVSVEIRSSSGTGFIPSAGDYDTTSRIDAIIQIHAEQVGTPGSSNTNNSGNQNSTGTTTQPDDNNDDEPIADATCEEGISTTNLQGMGGVAMASRPLYTTADRDETNGNVTPGVKFDILGESGNYWAIEYEGECGWVDSNYMAINLMDYVPEAHYDIANASSSIFRSSGQAIDGVTGTRLYTSDYNGFVPATFSFAQKLKNAASAARAAGDTLVIIDAYRPSGVSRYVNSRLTNLYNSNSTVKENIDYSTGASGARYTWGQGWFLAQGTSAHNTACAVDVTLSGYSMPSYMHELSTQAIKYYSPNVAKTSSNYSVGMSASEGAKKLSSYMMGSGGLSDLASEWWHYQDNSCHSRIGTGASFWSAV